MTAPTTVSSHELVIAAVLQCVCVELETAGRPVCSCAIRHAIQWPSMEGCCDCDHAVPPATGATHGQAWARFQRVDVADTNLLADDTQCGNSTTLVFDVGVHRCVSAYGDQYGSPVDPAVYTTDALSLINDEAHIRKAINCCGNSATTGVMRGWRWRATQSLPLGPLGGCAGVVVTVYATGEPRIVPLGS